jgi:hypothetical protein
MWQNIHELKTEQFSVLLPTMRKYYWCGRQQRETFFRVVYNSTEKLPALWVTMRKKYYNTEQYNIFCKPLSAFKSTVYLN